MPPRLMDLGIDWSRQYALESTTYDPSAYPEVAGRLVRLDGYLSATRAAVVACARAPGDWARWSDPWRGLADLLARVEAEFSGRLLIDPSDFRRHKADRDGLTWAVLAIPELAPLLRSADDLPRLTDLFARGVRVFGLAGLTVPWAQAVVESLSPIGQSEGPRPILDLGGLEPEVLEWVLGWLEADPARAGRLLPMATRRVPETQEALGRFRALGGWVGLGLGPPYVASTEALEAVIARVAALPRLGQDGYAGIGLATDFLGLDATLPGLGTASEVSAWVADRFDRIAAAALLHGNARSLMARASGAEAGF